MSLDFSERQRGTINAALTVIAALVIVGAAAGLILLLAIFLRSFSNVFLPLAVAAVISLVIGPYHEWWVRRLEHRWLQKLPRLPRVLAVLAVYLSLLLPFAGLVLFFGGRLIEEIGQLVDQWSKWQAQASLWIGENWPKVVEFWDEHQLQERLSAFLEGKGSAFVEGMRAVGLKSLAAGRGIFGALGSLFNWVLVPIYVAFILVGDLGRESQAWSNAALPFFKQETRDDVVYLGREFVEIIVAFFRGQLLIAFLQGVLYAIGFEIIGLVYGWVLGLCLGFLNIIPYLGSIVGLGVALPLGFFQGGGGLALVLGVLVVFTTVQMIEGYLLTPKIMGDQTGLHPMTIMVAIFFWGTALNGIMGMLLAIPLTAFFVVFWRLAREKYIRELV